MTFLLNASSRRIPTTGYRGLAIEDGGYSRLEKKNKAQLDARPLGMLNPTFAVRQAYTTFLLIFPPASWTRFFIIACIFFATAGLM